MTYHNFVSARFTGNVSCSQCGLVPLDDSDSETLCESLAGAVAYLTKDGSHLRTPVSRYGHDSGACAPVAYVAAVILAGEIGEPLTMDTLDYVMGLVVNNHDDPGYLIATYGGLYGFSPDEYLDDPDDWLRA